MKPRWRISLVVFFLITAVGFVLPFWPLTLLGIALLAFNGNWLAAILSALLIDLAWGAPVGFLHVLYAPFTACALLLCVLRWWGSEYFIDRNRQERL